MLKQHCWMGTMGCCWFWLWITLIWVFDLSLLSVSVTAKKCDCNFSVKINVLDFKIKFSGHFFEFSKIQWYPRRYSFRGGRCRWGQISCHGEHIATRGPLAMYTDPHTPDVLTFCRWTAFFACYSPMMLLFYSRNNLLTVYMFVFNIRSCCFAFVCDRLDS